MNIYITTFKLINNYNFNQILDFFNLFTEFTDFHPMPKDLIPLKRPQMTPEERQKAKKAADKERNKRDST